MAIRLAANPRAEELAQDRQMHQDRLNRAIESFTIQYLPSIFALLNLGISTPMPPPPGR